MREPGASSYVTMPVGKRERVFRKCVRDVATVLVVVREMADYSRHATPCSAVCRFLLGLQSVHAAAGIDVNAVRQCHTRNTRHQVSSLAAQLKIDRLSGLSCKVQARECGRRSPLAAVLRLMSR